MAVERATRFATRKLAPSGYPASGQRHLSRRRYREPLLSTVHDPGRWRRYMGTSDAFHYVYQDTTAGALTVTAQLRSILRTDEWAKAGVMIRATLDADSAHATIVITPDHGAAFQYRPSNGAQSTLIPFAVAVQAPYWVRIVRTPRENSFQFTGFVSANGIDWAQVGSTDSIDMPTAIVAGMAVTSHVDPLHNNRLQDLCTAVFDKVSLSN
jgi:hypothetical protein